MKTAALGALLLAGHAALLVALARRPAPTFELTVAAPPASATLTLDAEVPPALRARVQHVPDGLPPSAPGLRRVRWRAEYRGGHERSVGASQLVGPFQDPAAPPCSARVIIGQALLDDGAAGPGTLAHLVRQLLAAELATVGQFPIGDFGGVRALSLRWSQLAHHPEDAAMLGQAPELREASAGYLRAAAEVSFERVDVPVVLGFVPTVQGGQLQLRVVARARLAFGNRLAQWLSDHLGGDQLASSLTRRQLGEVLRTQLEPPPPLPLPGGGQLRFAPCGAPQIAEGAYGALPFSVAIDPLPGSPLHLPPLLAPLLAPPLAPLLTPSDAPWPTATVGATPLALELSLDALNAILYGAWRHGLLDRQLAAAGLVEKLHADPLVATYLSLRLTAPRLTLPPVLTAHQGGLRLAAESATTVRDGATSTLGRVWTAVQVSTASGTSADAGPALRAQLAELELTCEPRPHVLSPCYADLVAAVRDRRAEFTAPLTNALSRLVTELFSRRTIGTAELPAELLVRSAAPSLRVGAGGPADATLRLDLTTELQISAP